MESCDLPGTPFRPPSRPVGRSLSSARSALSAKRAGVGHRAADGASQALAEVIEAAIVHDDPALAEIARVDGDVAGVHVAGLVVGAAAAVLDAGLAAVH